jgi:transposase
MRSVGLDLGARHIALCEVVEGEVVARATLHSLKELEGRLGPKTPKAQVAFEACREGWHVHDMMERWGHEAHMLDTTRVRQIGVGHHRRKNDAIDAEAIAKALDAGRIPIAHLLSPARRALRAKLSVRGELVDMRARQVTLLRGLARAKGVRLPSSGTPVFLRILERAELDDETRSLMAPLVATLTTAEEQLAKVDEALAQIAKADPAIQLCATVPGVGVIVAATFVSVIDEAKRFRNAHAVSAYLGLVPGESSTGGKQRLGSITKQGNTHARRMLVQAAWLVLRTEKLDDPLYRWAAHIVETRGNRVAVVALARKLSGILWAIWRDGTVYDAAFVARKSAAGMTATVQSMADRARALERVARKIHAREGTARRAKALVLSTHAPRAQAAKGVSM